MTKLCKYQVRDVGSNQLCCSAKGLIVGSDAGYSIACDFPTKYWVPYCYLKQTKEELEEAQSQLQEALKGKAKVQDAYLLLMSKIG